MRDDLIARHPAPDVVADERSARLGGPSEHLAGVPAGVDDAVGHRRRGFDRRLESDPEQDPERIAHGRVATAGRING